MYGSVLIQSNTHKRTYSSKSERDANAIDTEVKHFYIFFFNIITIFQYIHTTKHFTVEIQVNHPVQVSFSNCLKLNELFFFSCVTPLIISYHIGNDTIFILL